ncbi:MAG: hypothetical protein MJH11_21475 [Lentisphaeria bacterium]|nr:hypothetical protein [Lentisphaeria bacterium]
MSRLALTIMKLFWREPLTIDRAPEPGPSGQNPLECVGVSWKGTEYAAGSIFRGIDTEPAIGDCDRQNAYAGNL